MTEPEAKEKEREPSNLFEPTSILFLILTILSLIAGMEAAFIVFGIMLFACAMRGQIYRWVWGRSPGEGRPG